LHTTLRHRVTFLQWCVHSMAPNLNPESSQPPFSYTDALQHGSSKLPRLILHHSLRVSKQKLQNPKRVSSLRMAKLAALPLIIITLACSAWFPSITHTPLILCELKWSMALANVLPLTSGNPFGPLTLMCQISSVTRKWNFPIFFSSLMDRTTRLWRQTSISLSRFQLRNSVSAISRPCVMWWASNMQVRITLLGAKPTSLLLSFYRPRGTKSMANLIVSTLSFVRHKLLSTSWALTLTLSPLAGRKYMAYSRPILVLRAFKPKAAMAVLCIALP